jgi:hypothetical protein
MQIFTKKLDTVLLSSDKLILFLCVDQIQEITYLLIMHRKFVQHICNGTHARSRNKNGHELFHGF